MNQAVIYARVSNREQEREGYSIPAQLKLLNEYATKHDLKIAKEFTDNETAKKEGRTNFTEMIKFLKQNKNINIILVEKTDRLYRNFKDYVLLEEFNDLEIHLLKEGIVLSEKSRSYDKFMPEIKLSEGLGCENILRIIIMEFLDPHNFDVRSVKRGCDHIAHSNGRIIPCDTYNVFYSDNKIKFEELARG